LNTIQIDFNLPERFDISYIDESGKKIRPVMLHRATFGSYERFLAMIIEHYQGAFPTWLSPVQVQIVPITDRNLKYGQNVLEQLKSSNIRVELMAEAESMQKKIRNAQQEKVFYMIIVGDQEIESKMINVRARDGETSDMKIEEFITHTLQKIHAKDVE